MGKLKPQNNRDQNGGIIPKLKVGSTGEGRAEPGHGEILNLSPGNEVQASVEETGPRNSIPISQGSHTGSSKVWKPVAGPRKGRSQSKLNPKIQHGHSGSHEGQKELEYSGSDTVITPQALTIHLFFSGPFPVPVRTTYQITVSPGHDVELTDLFWIIFGSQWQEFTGTLVLEQPSKLQRVGGPIYWHAVGKLDPRPLLLRVGDTTTLSEAGWVVVDNQIWLQMTYRPVESTGKRVETEDIGPARVRRGNKWPNEYQIIKSTETEIKGSDLEPKEAARDSIGDFYRNTGSEGNRDNLKEAEIIDLELEGIELGEDIARTMTSAAAMEKNVEELGLDDYPYARDSPSLPAFTTRELPPSKRGQQLEEDSITETEPEEAIAESTGATRKNNTTKARLRRSRRSLDSQTPTPRVLRSSSNKNSTLN